MSELDLLTHAATRALADSADAARDIVDTLPWLDRSITRDRAERRFDAWGRSTIIDENTGTPVIGRALFDELHRRAGLTTTWPIGNAGLLHSYGYLLSLEMTPYGRKRDRWIGSTLATACGLPPDAFIPWNDRLTLLARAMSAAFALLSNPVASATHHVDGRETSVAFTARSGPAALAYSVAPPGAVAPLLITMFPVADASATLAEFVAAFRLRWNAA